MSTQTRRPITMQSLVDDAAAGPSVRDRVIKVAGEGAIPYLDAFESGAQEAGFDLYEKHSADDLVEMYNRAHQKATKLASASSNEEEETNMPGTETLVGPDAAVGGVVGPEGGFSKLAADKLAEAQEYGRAVGQAQAEAFFDTMQKLAADDGLYKLAHFTEDELDKLADHHANDILLFTGRTTVEKVASTENLPDGRVAVIDMPLDEEVMAHVAGAAFQKIASRWGGDVAQQIEAELHQMFEQAQAGQ